MTTAERDPAGAAAPQVQRLAEMEEPLAGGDLTRWLAEYESRFGAMSEDRLREIATRTGVAYVPPRAS
ncbi:MAG: hypothetical protein ACFCVG_08115 [Kineosporiaceae bacterium]